MGGWGMTEDTVQEGPGQGGPGSSQKTGQLPEYRLNIRYGLPFRGPYLEGSEGIEMA